MISSCRIGRWFILASLVFGQSIAFSSVAGSGETAEDPASVAAYEANLCVLNPSAYCPTDGTAAEWQAAGATPRQAAEWVMFVDIDMCAAIDVRCYLAEVNNLKAAAIKWFKYGFTPSDAEKITFIVTNGGMEREPELVNDMAKAPDIANDWKSAGFNVADTLSWMKKRVSIQDALQANNLSKGVQGVWAAAIANHTIQICSSTQDQPCITPAAVDEWKNAGATPEQAAEWEPYVGAKLMCGDADRCNYHLERQDAIKWMKYGFTRGDARQITGSIVKVNEDPSSLFNSILNGDSQKTIPDIANDWRAAGFSVAATVYWISKGESINGALNTIKTRKKEQAAWAASGIPPKEKAEWIKLNFSAAAASQWTNAGISSAVEARYYRAHGIKAFNVPALLQALRGPCSQGVLATDPAKLNPYAVLGKCYFVRAEVTQILSSTESLAQTTDDSGFASGKFIVLDYVDKPTPGEGDAAYGVFLVKATKQYKTVYGGVQTVAVATLVYDIRQ